MDFLQTIRWNEIFGSLFQDNDCRVLAVAVALMLLTAAVCHWRHAAARSTQDV